MQTVLDEVEHLRQRIEATANLSSSTGADGVSTALFASHGSSGREAVSPMEENFVVEEDSMHGSQQYVPADRYQISEHFSSRPQAMRTSPSSSLRHQSPQQHSDRPLAGQRALTSPLKANGVTKPYIDDSDDDGGDRDHDNSVEEAMNDNDAGGDVDREEEYLCHLIRQSLVEKMTYLLNEDV